MQASILQKQSNTATTSRGWLARYWWHTLLTGLTIYALFSKDISIEVGLVNGGLALSEQTETPALGQDVVAMPAHLHEPAANVAPAAVKKEKEVPVANTMANLTPILSPDYARRKNIPQAVVDQKLGVCRAYVERYAAVAIQEMREHGIPASITLAQGLLESNAGESRLSVESNNHFGIKCRSKCRGCTCRNYSDDDIYDMFRVFESARESYHEHSALLNGSRYSHLKNHGNDYKKWAHGLKKAGYATDPRYAEKLIQIVEFLKLDRYDRSAI